MSTGQSVRVILVYSSNNALPSAFVLINFHLAFAYTTLRLLYFFCVFVPQYLSYFTFARNSKQNEDYKKYKYCFSLMLFIFLLGSIKYQSFFLGNWQMPWGQNSFILVPSARFVFFFTLNQYIIYYLLNQQISLSVSLRDMFYLFFFGYIIRRILFASQTYM